MNKEQLIPRLKSFAWRLGSYVVVSAIAFLGENIGLFTTNPQIIVLVALVSGEVTKYFNSK